MRVVSSDHLAAGQEVLISRWARSAPPTERIAHLGTAALRNLDPAEVGSGSGASNWSCLQHFRFTPRSRHESDILEPPLCAITGREQPQQAAQLFDHLIGGGEQRRRDREAESVRGLEINLQVEFGRLLHWKI